MNKIRKLKELITEFPFLRVKEGMRILKIENQEEFFEILNKTFSKKIILDLSMMNC